ncbi:MAG: hypothetical protein E7046_02940 [Lentisphaerae bacterium]|nr:hypothetical protein [Lentisphaerota bacterium]
MEKKTICGSILTICTIGFCRLCGATDVTVSVEGFLQTSDAITNRIVVESVPLSEAFPLEESAYPAFWFDCTQTNGWEISEDGKVSKIPSLSGSRYLTTTEFTSWTGWADGTKPPLPPDFLPSDETLGGMPSLDFGELGSLKAMMFDPHEYPSGAKTNILHNIGSIVAVWGSQNSGGWILGGGPNTWTGNTGASYAWHRRPSYVRGNNQFDYDSPLIYGFGYANPFNRGVRHDGILTDSYAIGFNRAWEVIALPAQDATAAASGLGLGDTRREKYWYSGGMKVAELMIFDRVLSAGEIVELEVWLQKKWFNRTVEGRGGNARISRLFSRTSGSDGAKTVLEVPEGETLSVGRLEGARGIGAAVVKRGAGTLSIKEASGYAGTLRMAGGNLEFSKRPIPSLSELPERYLHFDATDESKCTTVTRNDEEYLTRWHDLAGGEVAKFKVFLSQETEAFQPNLLRNALGEGLHMVDFRGVADGACMKFKKGAVESATDATLGSISTVIAVVGSQRGGGRVALLGHNAFHRAVSDYNSSTYGFKQPILNSRTFNSAQGISATNGIAWIDGLKKGSAEGFDTPGYQVVALKVPGGEVNWFGAANDGTAAGGFRVGEVFIYNRLLSDREIEDVQAYLMNRWFAREAPGYVKAAARASIPDVQNIEVLEPSAVKVGKNVQMCIESLLSPAKLTVSGSGTVAVQTVSASGEVSLADGTIRIVDAPETGLSQLAPGAVLHLDAADASSIETVEVNGTNFVKRWHSKDFLNAAYLSDKYAAYRPHLNSEKAVNGCPIVDFGGPYRYGAPFLSLEKQIDSMRDVYVVMDGEYGGGFLFGSRGGISNDFAGNVRPTPEVSGDFFPDIWASPYKLLTGTYSKMFTSGGSVLTNGVVVNPTVAAFPRSASLVEYHAKGAATGSWIGADKPTQYAGGFRIAELVVYDRTLSPRERVATRNYLMAKWFNAEAQSLPDDASESSIGSVSGSGTLVKDDAGVLSVGDFGSFTGTVSVASGTLTLSRPQAEAEPRLATQGRIAHFDASDASSVTAVEMDGYAGFSEWRSKVGSWKAVPLSKYLPEHATGTARLMRKSLNGLDTFFLDGASSPMLFEGSSGITNDISGIRTVFWVIGTVNNTTGGFILGGGVPKRGGTLDPWMGPDARKSNPAAPIIYEGIASGYVAYDNYCVWHLDGNVIHSYENGYKANTWHVMNMSFKDTVATSPTASGFAFDSRIMTQVNGWNDFKKYSGNQNLAEVIFYDRVLSEQERKETEAYLQIKWGLRSGKPDHAVFNIAEGATLDLGGAEHELPSVCGPGVIANGSLAVSKLTADAAVSEIPTLDGEVALKGPVIVDLKNITPTTSEIPILRAASVSGNLKNVVFEGDGMPSVSRMRLCFSNGLLFVKILNSGFSVILR